MPAVRGRWRKRVDRGDYLPLTDDVVRRHLSGDPEIGLYPLLDGDRCWWLAADFDGRTAMLAALAYVKAARAVGASMGLEVSRTPKTRLPRSPATMTSPASTPENPYTDT